MVKFSDRTDAGERLSDRLADLKTLTPQIVIGLARGGVLVAYTISRRLNIPLQVLVVKKIGSPGDPELAIGAQAPHGITVIDWDLAARVGADREYVMRRISELKKEIKITDELYRLSGKPAPVRRRNVILTDDGIATGATVRAAIKWLRAKNTGRIILAVPVMPARDVPEFTDLSDDLVFLEAPEDFPSVGSFYRDFSQVETTQVLQLLRNGKE